MFTLKELIAQENVTLAELTGHLDKLEPAERVAESMALGKKEQSRLWDLAFSGEGGKLTLDYLVSSEAPALSAFPFEGKNTLPLFTRFRKVFYHTADYVTAGYNKQPMSVVTGPGYFVVRQSPVRQEELEIDYTLVPDSAPEGFPKIKPNEAGLSRLVFAGMKDYLRWVSKDVLIGRAAKGGKEMNSWFILCRPAK